MKRYWPLQEAKANLSELVKKAQEKGPQYISVRGNPAVVMLSQETYESLTQPEMTLGQFLLRSPLSGANLDLKRDKSLNRDVELE